MKNKLVIKFYLPTFSYSALLASFLFLHLSSCKSKLTSVYHEKNQSDSSVPDAAEDSGKNETDSQSIEAEQEAVPPAQPVSAVSPLGVGIKTPAVTEVSPKTLLLTWESSTPDVEGFFISYVEGSDAPASCKDGTRIDVGLVTSFVLVELTSETNYSIRICSYKTIDKIKIISTGLVLTATTEILPLHVSTTSLADSTGYSFVEMAVDWDLSLAYLGSRETGHCVDVVDFSDVQNPIVVKNLSPTSMPATAGGACLGVELFDQNSKLIITSNGANAVEIWDLGADPTQLNFIKVASVTTNKPYRVAGIKEISPGLFDIHTSANSGLRHLQFDSTPPYAIQEIKSIAGNKNADAIWIDQSIIAGGWINANPINVYAMGDYSLSNTFSMDNGGGSGFWSAASSTDESKIFLGGWVSGFLSYDSIGKSFTLTHRIDNNSVYRDSVFVELNGSEYFFGFTASRILDAFNVDDIANPKLEFSTDLSTYIDANEGYSLEVSSAKGRALLVSNKGVFTIINIGKMTPETVQIPTF